MKWCLHDSITQHPFDSDLASKIQLLLVRHYALIDQSQHIRSCNIDIKSKCWSFLNLTFFFRYQRKYGKRWRPIVASFPRADGTPCASRNATAAWAPSTSKLNVGTIRFRYHQSHRTMAVILRRYGIVTTTLMVSYRSGALQISVVPET